jgi:NAD(P)-dependent dehydrogenase (short-subunit alcohol dehydrogenase family)
MLEKKVAIVTGVSSSPEIGRGIVKALANMGAGLVIADLVPQDDKRAILDLSRAVSEARAAGAEAIGMDLDITDNQSLVECVDHTLECFGRIDALVNITCSPCTDHCFSDVATLTPFVKHSSLFIKS